MQTGKVRQTVIAGLVVLSLILPASVAVAADGLDRTILPILKPKYQPITELDARKVKAPPRFEVKAPEGAPNVVIVLIDDIGFGHMGTFGGAIQAPTLERLAQNGLRYNQFHTTALCSPTRMALLTGRNHHSTNTGSVMEIATGFPGNQGVRPRSVAPLPETLAWQITLGVVPPGARLAPKPKAIKD